MECPICGAEDAMELLDEVDIGVGTMSKMRGWDCLECGSIPACECGQPIYPKYHDDNLCTKNLFPMGRG